MAAKAQTTAQLLKSYGALLDELRRRGVIRSSNNPLSDYAELLFCTAFGWRRMNNSVAGFDAVDDKSGKTYQIKGRRLTLHSTSRQLSAIRNLKGVLFDFLAGVLVDTAFQVIRAAIIPLATVKERSVRVQHTNSWKFMLLDDVWRLPGVQDATVELKVAARSL